MYVHIYTHMHMGDGVSSRGATLGGSASTYIHTYIHANIHTCTHAQKHTDTMTGGGVGRRGPCDGGSRLPGIVAISCSRCVVVVLLSFI